MVHKKDQQKVQNNLFPLVASPLLPAPYFFCTHFQFCSLYVHFGNACNAVGYLCLEDTYKNQSHKWPVPFTDTFFHVPKVSIYKSFHCI